jgi:hypothetical protein
MKTTALRYYVAVFICPTKAAPLRDQANGRQGPYLVGPTAGYLRAADAEAARPELQAKTLGELNPGFGLESLITTARPTQKIHFNKKRGRPERPGDAL